MVSSVIEVIVIFLQLS